MTTATINSAETNALTARTRATWMAGDFGQIAHAAGHIQAALAGPKVQAGDKVRCAWRIRPGNLTIPAARSGARVTGLDIAPNLLEQAQVWARREGLTLPFDEGNVEQMPDADASFAAVVSMFGAMFAPRADATANERMRVCRFGGRMAMANWTPAGFIGQMLTIMAKHGPPAPGVPSPLQWGNPAPVQQCLGNQIREMRCTPRALTFNFPFAPAATVACFRTCYGPTVRALATLDPAAQEALHRDWVQHWTEHNHGQNGTTQVDSAYLEGGAIRK